MDAQAHKITINGEIRETHSATIADLLRELHLHDRRVAVVLNESVVRRAEFESHPLGAGARIEIIALIGGG